MSKTTTSFGYGTKYDFTKEFILSYINLVCQKLLHLLLIKYIHNFNIKMQLKKDLALEIVDKI